jgi:hypothetical protein
MSTDDVSTILARLERSHRRWRRGALLAIGGSIVMLTLLHGSLGLAQGPRTVSAQRFVLLSPGGQTAGAVLEFTSRGPELALLGPGERPRLRIGLDRTGPSVELIDERGGKRASLAIFEGEPALVLYDTALKVRAVVSIAQDRPTVVLLDEHRRQLFHAP